MKLSHRRILYFGFFILFCVATPLLLMYALGYSYNPKKKSFENQGGLFVKYSPGDAHLSIDGTKRDNTSPTSVTDLLPGRYNIELRKESYHPWVKRIEILPRMTQTFSGVSLFPIATPTSAKLPPKVPEINPGPVQNFSVSPTKKALLVESNITRATTTIALTSLKNTFELPGIPALFQFDPASPASLGGPTKGIFSITAHREKRLEPHRFLGVKGFDLQNSSLLFWNEYELWMYSAGAEEPELITRNSRGVATAAFYRKHYLIYATLDGDVIGIEAEDLFGRSAATLATLGQASQLVVEDDTLFINSGTLTKPEWWEFPLK